MSKDENTVNLLLHIQSLLYEGHVVKTYLFIDTTLDYLAKKIDSEH